LALLWAIAGYLELARAVKDEGVPPYDQLLRELEGRCVRRGTRPADRGEISTKAKDKLAEILKVFEKAALLEKRPGCSGHLRAPLILRHEDMDPSTPPLVDGYMGKMFLNALAASLTMSGKCDSDAEGLKILLAASPQEFLEHANLWMAEEPWLKHTALQNALLAPRAADGRATSAGRDGRSVSAGSTSAGRPAYRGGVGPQPRALSGSRASSAASGTRESAPRYPARGGGGGSPRVSGDAHRSHSRESSRGNGDAPRSPSTGTGNGNCFNCGKPGHRSAQCTEPRRSPTPGNGARVSFNGGGGGGGFASREGRQSPQSARGGNGGGGSQGKP